MMAQARRSLSDDERTLHESDEDILQEEEDRTNLIAGPTTTGIRGLFSRRDPNQPRLLQPSSKETRRQKRKERKAKRRATKTDGDDGGSLLFGDSEEKADDDSASTLSVKRFMEKTDPRRVS